MRAPISARYLRFGSAARWILVLALLAVSGTPAPGRDARASANDLGRVGQQAPDLLLLQRAFEGVIARITPSVVGIRTFRPCFSPLPSGEMVADRREEEPLAVVNGTGTIIRADGAILTNEHVVQAAGAIDVLLYDGRILPAMIVAADARSDLAVLQIDADGLTPARFCDWDSVARGQWSLVLGNPYGLGRDGQMSFSVGVISNLDRRLPGLGEGDDRLYADMVQTTAPIHPGNSGGPLFNIRGELIGVVTAVHTRSVDDQGVGFAIPMSPARRRLIEQLLAGQRIRYGYLGVTIRELLGSERADLGLGALGILVQRVDPAGAAAQAGVQPGDILTHYGQQPITTALQFMELVGQTPVGQEITLKLRRDGTRLSLKVVIGEREPRRANLLRSGALLWRGMRITELTSGSRQHLEVDSDAVGLIVLEVVDGSPAARARLHAGDLIERVNDTPISAVTAFLQAVRGQRETVDLTVKTPLVDRRPMSRSSTRRRIGGSPPGSRSAPGIPSRA